MMRALLLGSLSFVATLVVAPAARGADPPRHAPAAAPTPSPTPHPTASPAAPADKKPDDKKPDAATAPAPDAGTTASEPAESGGRQSAIVARVTLKVVNPSETRAELRNWASEHGGFPVLITNTELILKVPPDELSATLARLGKKGLVLEKSLQREDLSLQIAKLEGQLESKRAILAELRRFFDTSDTAATLEIEKNMTSLVGELESVKGQLRVLRDRAHWVVIDVSFLFTKRDRVTRVSSPFEWLNTVDLDRFIQEFQ
jgi:hypothetical protein